MRQQNRVNRFATRRTFRRAPKLNGGLFSRDPDIRRDAVGKHMGDHGVLTLLAIKHPDLGVRLKAVELMDERDALTYVAVYSVCPATAMYALVRSRNSLEVLDWISRRGAVDLDVQRQAIVMLRELR